MLGQRQQEKEDMARGFFSIHLLCTSGHKPPAPLLPTCQDHVRDVAGRASSAQLRTSTFRLPQDPGPDTSIPTQLVISPPITLQGQDTHAWPRSQGPNKARPVPCEGYLAWVNRQQVNRPKRTGREPDTLGEFLAQLPTLLSPSSWSSGVGVIREVKSKTRKSQLPGSSLREEELLPDTHPTPKHTQHTNSYVVLLHEREWPTSFKHPMPYPP